VARPGTWLALSAAVVAVATDVLYLAIIRAQGPGEPGDWVTVTVVASVILALAACAGVAAVAAGPAPSTRRVLLLIATAGLFVMGVLGIFSIGLPLLGAGVLCLIAWTRATAETRPA
jgi:hypothetical protein